MAHGATIRTGLIGYGLAGRAFHAPLIAAVAGLDLVAIASSRADEIARDWPGMRTADRSEEHTSELQSLMRSSYAGFCLKKKKHKKSTNKQKLNKHEPRII